MKRWYGLHGRDMDVGSKGWKPKLRYYSVLRQTVKN